LHKQTNRPSNKLLAVFLFAQVMIYLNNFVWLFYDVVYDSYPHLFHIGATFIFIPAPSFYLYVKSIAYSDFQLKKKDLLHLLPFLLSTLMYAIFFHFHSAETKRVLISSHLSFPYTFRLFFDVAIFAQLFIYNIAGLNVLKEYRKKIKEQFSSIQNINLSWLNVILYGFLFAWLTSVLALLAFYYQLNYSAEMTVMNYLAFFLFFNFIFYKALIQPEIFSGVEEKPKYLSSKMTTVESEEYLAKLQSYMEEQKPFLNPTISLKDIAEQLSIPPRHLSQVINERLRQNYFDFISQYRIEEAKKILLNSAANKTVLEILFEVGFNSKSSFNTAFKKLTGTTPSKFKEMN
ncbi:MAG: AraC family transcriptional regulator, partial [Ignavibacteriae bacterium]